MNIDKTIDKFVADIEVITDFKCFFGGVFEHISMLINAAACRGYGFGNYSFIIKHLKENPIAFIRRYEEKCDIKLNLEDEEIMSELDKHFNNATSESIINDINEFRDWKIDYKSEMLMACLKLPSESTLLFILSVLFPDKYVLGCAKF